MPPPRTAAGVLAGDLGGTKILLELTSTASAEALFTRRYAAAGYAGFAPVLRAFLDEAAACGAQPTRIDCACFGVAAPVAGNRAQFTNLAWEIDAVPLARDFRLGAVTLVNDYVAAAHGLDDLGPGDMATLQAGEPVPHAPRVVLGAGTGFGAAYSIRTEAGCTAIAGEAGHAGFAPRDATQAALWQDIFVREGRVTVEHVVSGPGLARVYDFLRRTAGGAESEKLRAALAASAGPAAISAAALEDGDALALAALDLFAGCYGAAAGDLALALMACGGVYVAGGIAPQILPRLAAGGFVAAFRDKGVLGALMGRMPLHVVTTARLTLLGARRLALGGLSAHSAAS